MGILSNIDNDFFKPTVTQSKVTFDRDSFMRCMHYFIKEALTDTSAKISEFEHATWGTPYRIKELIDEQEQRRSVVSVWVNKEKLDRRITNIVSIDGLTRVWGEVHPHVPFQISLKPYILAKTTDVILTDDDDKSRYNLGPFIIMLPLGGQVAEMHWVPIRDPKAMARHPHHGLSRRGTNETNTCLGSFQEYVARSLMVGDIVSLLRFMNEYIRSYNPHSTLYRIHEIGHSERL